MEKKGFVKIHRKLLDNPHLMRDGTALRIFMYLLLSVNYETGQGTFGRKQIAEACRIKESSTYSSLKKLEKLQIINIKSNNKFSLISISKWAIYQATSNSTFNNESTTSQQPINTIKEIRIKNKEINTGPCKKEFPKYSPEWIAQVEAETASRETVEKVKDQLKEN